MNEKWKRALEINCARSISGTICIDHFEETDFLRNDKHHTKLKPNAIPKLSKTVDSQCIFRIEENELIEIGSTQSPKNELLSSCNCVQCEEKDLQINEMNIKHQAEMRKYKEKISNMDSKIKDIKKRLKKVNNKAYYLETTKVKLDQTIIDLRKENVLSNEARNTLQVTRFCCNTIAKAETFFFTFFKYRHCKIMRCYMSYSEESNIARNTQRRLGIFALAFITLAHEHMSMCEGLSIIIYHTKEQFEDGTRIRIFKMNLEFTRKQFRGLKR